MSQDPTSYGKIVACKSSRTPWGYQWCLGRACSWNHPRQRKLQTHSSQRIALSTDHMWWPCLYTWQIGLYQPAWGHTPVDSLKATFHDSIASCLQAYLSQCHSLFVCHAIPFQRLCKGKIADWNGAEGRSIVLMSVHLAGFASLVVNGYHISLGDLSIVKALRWAFWRAEMRQFRVPRGHVALHQISLPFLGADLIVAYPSCFHLSA